MGERSIIMSGSSVSGSMDGSKTQTRRIVKPQPPDWVKEFGYTCFTPKGSISGRGKFEQAGPAEKFFRCPYGTVGDRLYVKEGCWIFGRWHRNGFTASGRSRWRFVAEGQRVRYEKPEMSELTWCGSDRSGYVYRNSIFMPRWASRVLLTITDVRVQRLQEISEADARAEGVVDGPVGLCVRGTTHAQGMDDGYDTARDCYADLWDSINGAGAWERNDWVWAISFEVVR